MRIKRLLLSLAVLLAALASCKKDAQITPQSFQGKWYQVKLNMYQTDGTGARLYNTTYLAPFTASDYAQFNTDGTVNSSEDHYFYLDMPGQNVAPQAIPAQTATWNYTLAGTKYVLSPQNAQTNYSGFSVTDTLSIIHNDTLLWHSVLYSPAGTAVDVDDSYFVK